MFREIPSSVVRQFQLVRRCFSFGDPPTEIRWSSSIQLKSTWSAESRDVTGKVFEVEGGKIRVAEGWAHGPQIDKGARWDPAEVGPVVADLLAKSRPPVPVYGA